MARPRKWQGNTDRERDADRKRAWRALQSPPNSDEYSDYGPDFKVPELCPNTVRKSCARCRWWERAYADLEKSEMTFRRLAQEILCELHEAKTDRTVSTDPDGAEFRKAARLAAHLLASSPMTDEQRGFYVRMFPWLKDWIKCSELMETDEQA